MLMKLIKEEKINREISGLFVYDFVLVKDGLYLIEIIASATSWWQNVKSLRSFFKDSDLALILDKIEISTSTSELTDVRAAWNGNELKGLLKTVVIIVKLKKGKHVLSFTPDQKPYLKSIMISQLEETDKIIYIPVDNNPAEKGDGRPWLSFVLINLLIKDIVILAKASKKDRDDDDIKLIIDGETQKNDPPTGEKKSHQDWYWCGKILKGQEKEFKKTVDFNHGIHYIDLWADETPFLKKIEIAINEESVKAPTVDDPEWTGDFYDDPEQMILARAIFGEARSLSEKGKIAVGWSIKNRAIDTRWGDNYQDVILEPKQYSAFNKSDKNLPYVYNPFFDKTQIAAWHECYKIAGQVIAGEAQDPTDGANHYYSDYIVPPYWTKDKKAHFKIKIDNTLFYDITGNNPGGFIKLFSFILLIAVMAAGLLMFQQLKTEVKAQDAAQNIQYREYFINPKTEEINVLYLNEQGGIIGSKQLTSDQYKKSHLEIFYDNKMLGYFQDINKDDGTKPAEKDEYYKNYVKLMIKQGENETAYEVYRGDVHTSSWEWRDNKHVIVYYGCGTHCLYYYVININTKQTEDEGQIYE